MTIQLISNQAFERLCFYIEANSLTIIQGFFATLPFKHFSPCVGLDEDGCHTGSRLP
jgi:hypothetical protein